VADSLHDLEELATKIMDAQRKRRHEKHAKVYEPRSTTASSLGYKCTRRLVYARTEPHHARPIGEELSSIFEEGNLHQADVRRELIELGFEALEVELPLRDEDLEIGARIDGKLALSPEHRAERVPLEIKSCTGPPPQTAEAMRVHDGIYGRQYVQMQTYIYLDKARAGVFLYKEKVTGLWYLISVPADADCIESIKQRAAEVRDHIKAGTLPDRLADRSECAACPWVDTLCLPAEAPVDPLLLVEDAELLEQLEEREKSEASAKAFKKFDGAIKERFKQTKGDRFVVGDENGWLITKKPHGKGVRVVIGRLK